jgi:drug/metabolite transporter (DMT)-like permease
MQQVIQLLGALLVLAGFVLAQRGVLDARSRVYLLVNLVGSAVLAVDAWFGAQWGFFVLEGVWAVVSAAGLVGTARRAQTSSSSRRTENGSRQSSSASPSIVRRHS